MKHPQARAKIVLSALVILGLIGGFTLIKSNDPESSGFPFPPCLTFKATGLHCPGCGSTRALHAITQLDIGGAFRKNAFFVLAAPFLLYAAVTGWLRWLKPDGAWLPRRIRWPRSVIWSIFGLILAFAVLRNLPIEPFSLLAPR